MLKSVMLFLLVFPWINPLIAQITISNSTFPATGDTLKYAVDNNPDNILPGNSGVGNQLWDFSGLKNGQESDEIYEKANTASGFSYYPGAQLYTKSALRETFYRKSNTVFENMGAVGATQLNLGISTATPNNPALPERRAPMNFFDIQTVNSDQSWSVSLDLLPDSLLGNIGSLFDSLRVRIHTTRLDVVDAWGTCILPGGTYPVLREKRSIETETAIDIHSLLGWTSISGLLGNSLGGLLGNVGKDTLVEYHFMSNSVKEQIALLTADADGVTVRSVRYKRSPAVLATRQIADEARVSVFPNPGSGLFQIQLSPAISAAARRIDIFDAMGHVIGHQNIDNQKDKQQLDLSRFEQGLYGFRVAGAGGEWLGSGKIMLQQGK